MRTFSYMIIYDLHNVNILKKNNTAISVSMLCLHDMRCAIYKLIVIDCAYFSQVDQRALGYGMSLCMQRFPHVFNIM